MAPLNLANMQGDLYSRGFPKYNETYYFFSIVSAKEFSKALAVLAKSAHISSLQKVQEDWCEIEKREKDAIIPVANALIAFTKTGLDKVSICSCTSSIEANLGRFNLNCMMPNSAWTTCKTPILRSSKGWRKTFRRASRRMARMN